MKSDRYILEQWDPRGVLAVTLNRPELHNAFNDEFIQELISCFDRASKRNEIRLLLLKGEGKSFCAGADLNWMKSMVNYSREENYRDSLALARVFEVLSGLPFPTMAFVQGAALGGGTGLVAACDFVMATEKAQFGFTEVHLGLVPAVISPFVLRKISASQALAYFTSGERFTAKRAQEMGLVHEIVSEEKGQEEVEKRIGFYLRSGPEAVRVAKKLVEEVSQRSKSGDPAVWEEIKKYTCETISRLRTSAEGQEGMSALLEKRSPSWRPKS